MSDFDLANALYGRPSLAGRSGDGVAVTYGTAVSDSENGKVSVILDGEVVGDVVSGDDADNVLVVETSPSVREGDTVMVTLTGTTAKTPVVTAVVGSGDEVRDASVVSTVTEYAQSEDPTTAPTAGWSTDAPAFTQGKYIWMRQTFTHGGGDSETTEPVIITGNTGAKGEPGASGGYVHIAYANKDEDGNIIDFDVSDPTGRSYMGVYTDENEDDPTDPDVYSWSLIKGVGVLSTGVEYAVSASGVEKPTEWQTDIPSVGKGSYLWTRTTTGYTDGTESVAYSIAYQAADGTSVLVESTAVEYQVGGSATEVPTGTWSEAIPEVADGKYLWTRTTVNYSPSGGTVAYSVSYKAGDGQSVSEVRIRYQLGDSSTEAPTGEWQDDVPDWVGGKYIWQRTETVIGGETKTGTPVLYGAFNSLASSVEGNASRITQTADALGVEFSDAGAVSTLIRETSEGIEVGKSEDGETYSGTHTVVGTDAFTIHDASHNELASFGETITLGDKLAIGVPYKAAFVGTINGSHTTDAKELTIGVGDNQVVVTPWSENDYASYSEYACLNQGTPDSDLTNKANIRNRIVHKDKKTGDTDTVECGIELNASYNSQTASVNIFAQTESSSETRTITNAASIMLTNDGKVDISGSEGVWADIFNASGSIYDSGWLQVDGSAKINNLTGTGACKLETLNGSTVPDNPVFTDTKYTLPAATSSTLGGVKVGSNITNESGTISLSKANVTAALGYTPPTANTTYSAGTGLSLSGTTFSVPYVAKTVGTTGNAWIKCFGNVVTLYLDGYAPGKAIANKGELPIAVPEGFLPAHTMWWPLIMSDGDSGRRLRIDTDGSIKYRGTASLDKSAALYFTATWVI